MAAEKKESKCRREARKERIGKKERAYHSKKHVKVTFVT